MIDRLLLVGCGLMGGSVAAALRAQWPSVQVWVVDPVFGEQAVEEGLAHRAFTSMQAMLGAAAPPGPPAGPCAGPRKPAACVACCFLM